MSGICGVFYRNTDRLNRKGLLESINPLGFDLTTEFIVPEGLVLTASRRNSHLRDKGVFDGEGYSASMAGDLVGPDDIPWEKIIGSVRSGDYSYLKTLRGLFAIVILDRETGKLYLITDRFGFFPIYYELNERGFVFSTWISSFAHDGVERKINPHWIYEYFYFSFPVLDTAMYENVRRLQQASVLCFDIRSRSISVDKYADDFRRNPRPYTGRRALRVAEEVFSSVIPIYFERVGEIAHALTGGYDTRTILAFLPDEMRERVLTYTYGMKGCEDLNEAASVARALGLEHRELYFDEEFVGSLPELIVETVLLSSALENINRSYLPFTYRAVSHDGSRYPVTISGIGGDALFRGHVPVPNGLSADMERAFLSGEKYIDMELFKGVFGSRFDDFYQYIDATLDRMVERYGGFDSMESFFYYQIYDGLPKYFNGEVFVADNFTALRIPFFDPRIIQLACDIEYSTFKLIRFVNEDQYIENLLQAYLLSRNRKMARIPIHGMPLKAFTVNNRLIYQLYRAVYKGPRKVKNALTRSSPRPLEVWDEWQRGVLGRKLRGLLLGECEIRGYVTDGFLREIFEKHRVHWVKIASTVEIALRLARNSWRKDDAPV